MPEPNPMLNTVGPFIFPMAPRSPSSPSTWLATRHMKMYGAFPHEANGRDCRRLAPNIPQLNEKAMSACRPFDA